MTKNNKTAIQQAEKQLEQERAERLKNEVYNYLKGELEAIDEISSRITKLSEEKRAHEENVKNVKQGNLKAIEERRKSFDWTTTTTTLEWVPANGSGLMYLNSTGSSNFYAANVAGTTITTSNGKTYIF